MKCHSKYFRWFWGLSVNIFFFFSKNEDYEDNHMNKDNIKLCVVFKIHIN